MAGFYPDVPGPRMALDKDGTQWLQFNSSWAPSAPTGAAITGTNDWDAATGINPNPDGKVAMIFPEKRDVVGMFFGIDMSQVLSMTATLQWSANTTNGVDGTWTTFMTLNTADIRRLPMTQSGRNQIYSTALNGVKGLRYSASSNGNGPLTWHVYGQPSAGQVIDRLAFWHPTLDQEMTGAFLDWGDVKRGTTETRQFRVKNLSTSKTANSPRVAMESLTDTTPSVTGQHAISTDNATWVAQITMANMAPGALSSVMYVRRTTPLNAMLSHWNMRLFSEATTWS